MSEKIYETDELRISWKPKLCQHAAECVKGAPAVFDVGRKPWIQPENGTTDLITKVIDKCPSGALSYTRK
ncbi:(4Fe-4S)-binding protein [Veillonella criceti]|uniref:Uncharacterized conserved protein n=1 Tax=Veillonella criceti TaxID=103891 RepID=A0A380NIQ2_9FIRM|nr:(4Fe-4S)-binding protein [Veillonella criceti]SUP41686.1 Uncharacterized conserved protein [Veillonella criceti]